MRHLVAWTNFEDHMGPGLLVGMQPEILWSCDLPQEHIVALVVLATVQRRTVTQHKGPVRQRCRCRQRHRLGSLSHRERPGGAGPLRGRGASPARSAQLQRHCLQGLPLLRLRNLLLHTLQVALFLSALGEEFLHFHESMFGLAILVEVGLGIVTERQAWVKRNSHRGLVGTVVIYRGDTRCPTWHTLRHQQRAIVLVGQVALQFAVVLSEIGHLLTQFLEPLPYGFLYGVTQVRQRCSADVWSVKGCHCVLGACKGLDGASTMRQWQGTEIPSALRCRTDR